MVAAEEVQRTKIGLRLGQAHFGGCPQPAHAFTLVALDSDADQQHQAQVVLCVGIASLGCPGKPLRCFGVVLVDPNPGSVEQSHRKPGPGMAACRNVTKLTRSLAEVPLYSRRLAALVIGEGWDGNETQHAPEQDAAYRLFTHSLNTLSRPRFFTISQARRQGMDIA